MKKVFAGLGIAFIAILLFVGGMVTMYYTKDKIDEWRTSTEAGTSELSEVLSSKAATKLQTTQIPTSPGESYFYYYKGAYIFVFEKGVRTIPQKVFFNSAVSTFLKDLYENQTYTSITASSGTWTLKKVGDDVIFADTSLSGATQNTNSFKINDDSIHYQGAAFDVNKYPFRLVVNFGASLMEFEAPVISAPEKIYKSTTSIMDIDDISGKISAVDVVDGDLTPSLVVRNDNFTGNGHLEGAYTYQVESINSLGLYSIKSISIIVDAEFPDILFATDDLLIVIENDKVLTSDMIVKILTTMEKMTVTGTGTLSYTINQYKDNEANIGTYSVSVKYRSASGVNETHDLTVQVVEAGDGIELNENTGNWFTQWGWIVLVSVSVVAVIGLIVVKVKK
ncbi:hypothetical protein LJC17_01425 [Acholeplasma sp. OttesenSCG-928-E16]|nr:hypothetical protein [Acholeplasma sp. OttesenSCG-928-E16]